MTSIYDYTLIKFIAKGSDAVLYKALNKDNQVCAIRITRNKASSRADEYALARLINRIDSKHIVKSKKIFTDKLPWFYFTRLFTPYNNEHFETNILYGLDSYKTRIYVEFLSNDEKDIDNDKILVRIFNTKKRIKYFLDCDSINIKIYSNGRYREMKQPIYNPDNNTFIFQELDFYEYDLFQFIKDGIKGLSSICIDIFNGIKDLQKYKLIHYDIHVKNVLVGKRDDSYYGMINDFTWLQNYDKTYNYYNKYSGFSQKELDEYSINQPNFRDDYDVLFFIISLYITISVNPAKKYFTSFLTAILDYFYKDRYDNPCFVNYKRPPIYYTGLNPDKAIKLFIHRQEDKFREYTVNDIEEALLN